jgi:transcriptional regulator with XRE-family HTH domain
MAVRRTPQQIRTLNELGDRIKTLRTIKGLTQEALAFQSGLHPTYISSVERGQRNIAVLATEAIASALNVPIRELFPDAPPSDMSSIEALRIALRLLEAEQQREPTVNQTDNL